MKGRGLVDVRELLEGALAEKVRGVAKRIMPLIVHQAGEEEALRMNIVNAMKPEFVKAKTQNKIFNPEKAMIARLGNILADVSTSAEFEDRARQVFRKGSKIKNNPYVLFQKFPFAWKIKFDMPAEDSIPTGRPTVKKLQSTVMILENRLKQAGEERSKLEDVIAAFKNVVVERDNEIVRLKEEVGKMEMHKKEKIIITNDEKEGKIVITILQ